MRKNGKANSLLIELIIVIFFFAIASTVSLQLFLNSNSKTAETQRLNMAIINVQSVLEKAQAGIENGDIALKHTFENAVFSNGNCTLYYDKDWKEVPQDGCYSITISSEAAYGGAGKIYTVLATARCSDGTSIWGAESKQYIPDFKEDGD